MEQHFLDIVKPTWDACTGLHSSSLCGCLCLKTLSCDSCPSTSYWESPQAAIVQTAWWGFGGWYIVTEWTPLLL